MSEYLNIGLDITGLLDNSPTHGKGPALIMCRGIEYMPVRHATDKGYEGSYGWNDVCSLCGCEFTASRGANYCPNCGAKLDDEEYENEIINARKSEE